MRLLLVPFVVVAALPQPAMAEDSLKHLRSATVADGPLRAVAFSPDGKTLACTTGRDVQLLRVADGSRVRTLEGHKASVRCVAFSGDGSLLASGGEDTTIRLWDAQSGKLRKVFKQRKRYLGPVNSVAFTPGGRKLVSCSSRNSGNSHLWIWDIEKGNWEYIVQTRGPRFPLHLAVSPDGATICVGEFVGNVALYEFVKFGVRERFVREQGRGFPQGFHMYHDENKVVSSVSYSPDGQTILSSAWDNTVRVWQVRSGRQVRVLVGPEAKKGFAGAAFSRDGSRVVAVTKDETVQLWDIANGKELATVKGSDKAVRGLQISPTGNVLATFGSRGIVEFWEITLKP